LFGLPLFEFRDEAVELAVVGRVIEHAGREQQRVKRRDEQQQHNEEAQHEEAIGFGVGVAKEAAQPVT
jgi:hypothetical protein